MRQQRLLLGPDQPPLSQADIPNHKPDKYSDTLGGNHDPMSGVNMTDCEKELELNLISGSSFCMFDGSLSRFTVEEQLILSYSRT